jgi:hypothetical protein
MRTFIPAPYNEKLSSRLFHYSVKLLRLYKVATAKQKN